MNEYEITELTHMAMGLFLTTFSVFLSVATAYLVAIYLVGNKLSTLQLFIVNGSYLISTTILGYLTAANFRVFYIYASTNVEGTVRKSGNGPLLIDFTWPITILLSIIVVGSITFMYSIRNQSINDTST